MARLRSATPRRVALAAALALSAAACGGGSSDASDVSDADTDGSTTTVAGGDGTTGAAAGGSADGDASATAGGAISSASTVPLELTDLKPNKHGAPFPGRYLYDVAGTDEPVELSVRDVLGDQDSKRFDRTGDLGQIHIEVEGSEARASLVQWSSKGLFLNAEQRAQNTTTGLNESAVCDYKPDLSLQPVSLKVGATWNDESSCTAKQGDVTLTRERKLTGEALAASTAQVGGQTVPTVRIKLVTDTTTTSDSTPPLIVTERREVVMEWIVSAGLAAKVEGQILETISGTTKAPRLYTWTLRTTQPSS